MRRGGLVATGDYGKPRPAVIVQAGAFPEGHASVVCQLTSGLVDAPDFRVTITIGPKPENRLPVGGPPPRATGAVRRCGTCVAPKPSPVETSEGRLYCDFFAALPIAPINELAIPSNEPQPLVAPIPATTRG
jgi:hypothetical protein